MDFYIEVSEEIFERIKELDPALGMWFWNIAVMSSPYDTGNLRRSITLNRNTSKVINIRFNTMQANYITFLEEGVGPVKKYKGFIGNNITTEIVEQLLGYLKTGVKPIMEVPSVVLRGSKQVFRAERNMLRQAGMYQKAISATARNRISIIREANYRKQKGLPLSSFSGRKVETTKTKALYGTTLGAGTLKTMAAQARRIGG